MALQQIKFAPGIDKQDTSVGAVGRWVDSDNVRFRYGLPEKVGGWQSLLTDSIVGVARKQHAFVDNKGNIIKQLNRNEAGNIEFEVPLIKSNKVKNDLIFFILLITYLFIFLIYKKNAQK